MKSFNEISRWLHILVATLVVWSQSRVEAIFVKLEARNYALLGTLVLAIIGIQLSDRLVSIFIERTRWIRRLLSGQNDIEGDWVDIVVNTTEPHRIIYTEYSRVRYKKGEYVMSGDTWTVDGKWVGEFCTSGSNYQDRVFEYYYKTGLSRVGGFGVIIYSPNDSLPTESYCRYIDEEIGTPHVTRGQRISKKLSKVSMDDRKAIALKFARGFDESGLLDLEVFFGKKTNI